MADPQKTSKPVPQRPQEPASDPAADSTSMYVRPDAKAKIVLLAAIGDRSVAAQVDVLVREHLANHPDLAHQIDA